MSSKFDGRAHVVDLLRIDVDLVIFAFGLEPIEDRLLVGHQVRRNLMLEVESISVPPQIAIRRLGCVSVGKDACQRSQTV